MSLKRKIHNLFHPELGQVLMMHRVTPKRSRLAAIRELEVTPQFLEQTIVDYQQKCYRFVDMDEAYRVVQGGQQTGKFVCFTFDDGYLDNYTEAYPVFKKYNCPFTLYLTTDFLERKALLWWYVLEDLGVGDEEFDAYRKRVFDLKPSEIENAFSEWFPESAYSFAEKVNVMALNDAQLKEMVQSGLCQVGCHTVSHPFLSRMDKEEQFQEVFQSKEKLERLLGNAVDHFAYPYGDYNQDTIDLLKELNFKTGVKTWGGKIRKRDSRPFELYRIELRQ